MQQTQFSGLGFILDAGPVALAVTVILLVMSIASWYVIATKSFALWKLKNATKRYTMAFWSAANLQLALKVDTPNSPNYQLAHRAVEASQHHQAYASTALEGACSHEEFVARSMRRSVAQTASQLESGLSVLASVGSVSPFVGLFGTVWGIYHALAAISMSGQATLDKVAGPVGESLIMTAIGLAVAIPAVLAYNALLKAQRNVVGELDQFAQDLHILITTGATLVKKSAVKTHSENRVNIAPQANNHGASA